MPRIVEGALTGALAEAIEALSETPWNNPWKLKILLCIIILHPCLKLNSCESSAWASWPSLVQVDESALKGVRQEACTVAIPFPYLMTSKTLISLIWYTEDQREHFPTEFPAGTSGTFRSHYFVYVVMYLVLSFIYLYLVSFLVP